MSIASSAGPTSFYGRGGVLAPQRHPHSDHTTRHGQHRRQIARHEKRNVLTACYLVVTGMYVHVLQRMYPNGCTPTVLTGMHAHVRACVCMLCSVALHAHAFVRSIRNGYSPTNVPQRTFPNECAPTNVPQRMYPNGCTPTDLPQRMYPNG